MRSLLPAFALLSALAVPITAHADSFTVTGSGGGFSGTATLTTTANGGGSYTITGISGSSFLNGILTAGTFNGNDNLFFPTSTTLVDSHGFAFSATQGDTSFRVDVFSTGPGAYSGLFLDNDGFSATVPLTMSVVTTSAVPEPSSLLLLVTGLLGAAALFRKRPVPATASSRRSV